MGTNRNAYAGGDPVNGVDPSGHCFWDACIVETIIFVGAAISSLLVADAAIDISNGGNLGDSPLGNPVGQIGANAIQGGATIVGIVTGEGDDSSTGIGHNSGEEDDSSDTGEPEPYLDQDGVEHILDGHIYCAGKGKSEFPESWSEDDIMHGVEEVAKNGTYVPGLADTPGGRAKEGVVVGPDGADFGITAVIDQDGRFVTGYPTKNGY